METMADRIALVLGELKARGITATAFAECIGVSKGAVSKWANGDTANLKNEHLFAIEDIYQYSARWIATGRGPRMLSEVREEFGRYMIDEKIAAGDLLDISSLSSEAKNALEATVRAFEKPTVKSSGGEVSERSQKAS